MKLFPLTESARLPYEKIKGSISQRNSFAENMTYNLVENVQQKLARGDISIRQLSLALKKSIPKNIVLFVEKNNDKTQTAALSTLVDDKFNVFGYLLEVCLNKQSKFTPRYIPTIGHEMRHLSDYLAHPKVPVREHKLDTKGLFNKKYFDLYENEVYMDEIFSSQKDKDLIIKKLRKKIKNFLKGCTPEDKIDYLQCMRYGLIFEENAYRTESEIAKVFCKKNASAYRNNIHNRCDEFMFKEKIELLKKMTLEIITNERNKHHAKLKHSESLEEFLKKIDV